MADDDEKDKRKTRVPGPGAYNTNSKPFGLDAPSYGMPGRRREVPPRVDRCGPGEYNIAVAGVHTAPAAPGWKFSQATRNQDKDSITPAPSAYEIKHTPKKQQPSCVFGNEKRLGPTAGSLRPGPGAYTPDTKVIAKSGPAYSTVPRRDMCPPNANPGPGPGAHNVGDVSIAKPNYKASAQYRFGTEDRLKQTKTKNMRPGPGSYDTKSTFGQAAAFSITPRRDFGFAKTYV